LAVDQYPRLDLRHIINIVQRRLWLIVGATVAVAVLVFAFSASQPSMYKTFADVATTNPDIGDATTTFRTEEANRRLSTEVYYVQSPAVERRVVEAMGQQDFDQISDLDVEPIESTDVIRITVSSASPEIARAAANAYAESYVTQRRAQLQQASARQIENIQAEIDQGQVRLDEISEELANTTAPGTIQALTIEQATLSANQTERYQRVFGLTDRAEQRGDSVSVSYEALLPEAPFEPNPIPDALVAALVVLILTVGLAFLIDQLDNRIKTAEDVARVADGLPVIGSIPLYHQARFTPRRFQRTERSLVSPTSTAAEAYRVLATSLRFSSLGKEKRTILITSSFGGEGKTTVTANLAAMLAESGLRVVIVSADLRRPQLGALLGIPESNEGLTSAMLGDSDLSTCFVPVALPSGKNLYVLPAGPLPHEPAVLLGSDAFGEMLEEIKEAGADFILIDCAPVLPVSDPLAAARHVDGVLLLTMAEKTKQASFRTAVERLRKVNAEIIGVVLNGVGAKGTPYAYQYYGYGSYNRQEPDAPATAAPAPSPADEPESTKRSALGRVRR
jgi:capsular exopolysaccharide synthesis family protein